ncbi:hypothetical protein DV701_04615 [Ornithinimicrobium avium]|uniref:Uncharacterized protein n=1 Tax=Ornithinimicrobium avium TaxID=2283195 RepID=A0A345NKF1_9MICO|nr:hypothetical protein DV701_04615 [Ornithinimicrobium avium]
MGGRLRHSIRSLTSTLVPDVGVFLMTDHEQRMVVVDAKRRSALTMRADDVAEASSKYVWGLRVSPPSDGAPRLAVDRVVLASTAQTPEMYSDHSRIEGSTVVPGRKSDLMGRVNRALGLAQ